jgi:hypothetical protein
MSHVVVKKKELFKIIDRLEKAKETFINFICNLDFQGVLIDEDEPVIEEIAALMADSKRSLKSLTEAN